MAAKIKEEENNDATPGNIRMISAFEYEMCETFIKNCVRTTFPEHRQNFMKAIRSFMMRLRSVLSKDIKKYIEMISFECEEGRAERSLVASC